MPCYMLVDTRLLHPFFQMLPANGIMGKRKYFLRHHLRVARETYYLHQVIAERHNNGTVCASTLALDLIETKSPRTEIQERQIEIYVDDEYLGRDLVYYTVPKGREYIEVSCRENGMEVYHRRINVKNRKGTLIELQIPKNYKYSSKPF